MKRKTKSFTLYEIPKGSFFNPMETTIKPSSTHGYDYEFNRETWDEDKEEYIGKKVFVSRKDAIDSCVHLVCCDWYGSSNKDYYLVDDLTDKIVFKIEFNTVITNFEE